MSTDAARAAANHAAHTPEPDFKASVSFLHMMHPKGPWLVCAIWYPPEKGGDSEIDAATFGPRTEEDVIPWLRMHHLRKHELYFTVNRVAKRMTKKCGRKDIVCMPYLHLDLDPVEAEELKEGGFERERARILALLDTMDPQPSVKVDTGGGYATYWALEEPIRLDGSKEQYEDAKLYNLALELKYGGDNCHNIDRVMRLPGTVNWGLNPKKVHKGRKPRLAVLL
jgi:hypothetical protein